MTVPARHPLDDLADNSMAQSQFFVGFVGALKTAGWDLPMIEGFIDSITPVEDFMAKEEACLRKVADENTLKGLPGTITPGMAHPWWQNEGDPIIPNLQSMPAYQRAGALLGSDSIPTGSKVNAVLDKAEGGVARLGSGITSLGGLFPNRVSDDLRQHADESWGRSNLGQMQDSAVGEQVAKNLVGLPPEQQAQMAALHPGILGGEQAGSDAFKQRWNAAAKDPGLAKTEYDRTARAQHLGGTVAAVTAMQGKELTDDGIRGATDVQSGAKDPQTVAADVGAPIGKNYLDQKMPGNGIETKDLHDLATGNQNLAGLAMDKGPAWASQQLKQRFGMDMSPETIGNMAPGLISGLLTFGGAKMLGADWTTAMGLGVGGGLLGGNVYQANQTGRTMGQQAEHVGKYLGQLNKQYVSPLFSTPPVPTTSATQKPPIDPGTAGAPPVAGAPQHNANAPDANNPAVAKPALPAANAPAPTGVGAASVPTQNQAQQAGAAAAAGKPISPVVTGT